MLFETGSDELKVLEQKVYVAAGRFIIEAGKNPVVEYLVSEVDRLVMVRPCLVFEPEHGWRNFFVVIISPKVDNLTVSSSEIWLAHNFR